MMKYLRNMLILSLLFSLTLLVLLSPTSGDIEVNQETQLTIYTYESLLADPGYAFDRAFEIHAGLPNNSVDVVLLDDAGSIVTRAASEKGDPVADVLIGIDNVLVHQARMQEILTPYVPEGNENIIDGLVEGLATDYLLTPYDFGVISLWYLQNEITNNIDPESFSLDQLLDENLDKQLIVENPLLSSPGLGFLLSTIALYGDHLTDAADGLISGNWVDFWRELSVETSMTSSWGDAISQLYTPEANRSMMVSYSSSPAYGACLYDDYTTTALLPSIGGQKYGWQQIEGLGLVNGAPNEELAKDFIDWFLTEELQSQIHQNQWVYPAIEGIPAPECYDAAIDPSEISPLNSILTQSEVEENLNLWFDNWELAWVEGPVSDNQNLPVTMHVSVLIAVLVLFPLINKKNRSE